MRRIATSLAHDNRGGVLVEFALVSQTVAFLIVAMLQVGTLFYASTTMRSALGEGARLATVWRTPVSNWAGPPATEICTRVMSRIGTMNNSQVNSLTITRPALNGTANSLLLTMNYRVNLDFILFSESPVMTKSRRVYVRTQPNFTSHTCALS